MRHVVAAALSVCLATVALGTELGVLPAKRIAVTADRWGFVSFAVDGDCDRDGDKIEARLVGLGEFADLATCDGARFQAVVQTRFEHRLGVHTIEFRWEDAPDEFFSAPYTVFVAAPATPETRELTSQEAECLAGGFPDDLSVSVAGRLCDGCQDVAESIEAAMLSTAGRQNPNTRASWSFPDSDDPQLQGLNGKIAVYVRPDLGGIYDGLSAATLACGVADRVSMQQREQAGGLFVLIGPPVGE